MKPTVVLFIESYYRGEDVVCSIAVKIIIENFNLVQTVKVLLFAGRRRESTSGLGKPIRFCFISRHWIIFSQNIIRFRLIIVINACAA